MPTLRQALRLDRRGAVAEHGRYAVRVTPDPDGARRLSARARARWPATDALAPLPPTR